jgi:radical SAM protein with 4Fe4S-binding SPASM domain
MDRLRSVGVPYFIFTGGEPTLYPGLPELVGHAAGAQQITGLNTNGRRLADPVLVADLQAAGLDHVQITLLSHQATVHDRMAGAAAYAETLAGLDNCLQAGLHTLTNTTLLVSNLPHLPDLLEFLHERGVRTFALNACIHSGCGQQHPEAVTPSQMLPTLKYVQERAEELGLQFLWYTPTRYCELSPLEQGLGLRSCNAGEYSICVEPDGEVLPCQSWYCSAGNLLHDRWEDLWDSALFRRWRHRRERPFPAGLPASCHRCEQLQFCGGGCALELSVPEEAILA